MPYGEINASLEISNGEIILHMGDDRSYILSENQKKNQKKKH